MLATQAPGGDQCADEAVVHVDGATELLERHVDGALGAAFLACLRDRLDDEVQPVIHHSVADDQRIARQVEDQVEVAWIRVPVSGPLERRCLDLRDEVEDGVRLCVAQRRNLSLDD